jgi:hypothetical protein
LRRNNRDDCSFKLVAEGQGVGRSVVHYADPAYAFGQDCAACGAMATLSDCAVEQTGTAHEPSRCPMGRSIEAAAFRVRRTVRTAGE